MASGSSTTRDKKKKSVEPSCFQDPNTKVVYHSMEERLEGFNRTVHDLLEQQKEMRAIQKQKKKTKASIGSSSPPKNSSEKKEYVKPTGTGHEASGAGDGGASKRDDKKDHGGGGGGGSGDGGGGGDEKKKKKKKEKIYCVKCERSFFPEDFKDHECKKVHSNSTIDG